MSKSREHVILYGTSRSRASRALVVLDALGVAYEHVPLLAGRRDRGADRGLLSRLNPNGHIPVLDDGGVIVWESMAINLHLGQTRGGALWPADPSDLAATYQWSFWGQTEVDRADWNRARRSGDHVQIAADRQDLVRTLGILDRALDGRDYLLGAVVSLVDLNLAATLSEPHERGLIGWQKLDPEAAGLRRVADWLARMHARPSFRRVLAMP